MKRIFQVLAILCIIGPIITALYLKGVIPSVLKLNNGNVYNDIAYEKSCGIPPSKGDVWTYPGAAYNYFRLKLSQSDYIRLFNGKPRVDFLTFSGGSPWWCNPHGDNLAYYREKDLGAVSERLYIYDPKEEYLYVRTEWK